MRIGTIADLHFDRHQRLTMEDYLEAVVRLIDQSIKYAHHCGRYF